MHHIYPNMRWEFFPYSSSEKRGSSHNHAQNSTHYITCFKIKYIDIIINQNTTHLSSVLRCGPFLWCLKISIVFLMVPNGQILRLHKKGPHLNTLERFHMYAEYVNNNHINDNQTIFPNRLFDVLLNAQSKLPPPTLAPLQEQADTWSPQHTASVASNSKKI